MKRILNLRPALRKQMAISDPDIVLNYVKQLDESSSNLSSKLVIFLSIWSVERNKTVKAPNINHLVLENSKLTFSIKTPLKLAREKINEPSIKFRLYPGNEKFVLTNFYMTIWIIPKI